MFLAVVLGHQGFKTHILSPWQVSFYQTFYAYNFYICILIIIKEKKILLAILPSILGCSSTRLVQVSCKSPIFRYPCHISIFCSHGQVFCLHGQVFCLHGQVFCLRGQVFYLHGQVFCLHGQVFVQTIKFFVQTVKFFAQTVKFLVYKIKFLACTIKFFLYGQVFICAAKISFDGQVFIFMAKIFRNNYFFFQACSDFLVEFCPKSLFNYTFGKFNFSH